MPDVVVIRPPDEIDPASVARLDDQLRTVDPEGTTVVDFASVAFCDSSGIRVLVLHATRHLEAGGRLVVRDPAPAVQRAFAVTGVDELLGTTSA